MRLNFMGIVLLTGLAALVLAGCGTTQAERVQTEHDALCAALDTNHDGKITREEFMARASNKEQALKVYENCGPGTKGYLTYNEVINQRRMIPPEIYLTTPPVLVPRK